MKEKKQTEIATNTSSGAEKVETVVEKTTTKRKTPEEKAKKEKAAADARVQAALKNEKAKTERIARIEKRKAEHLARVEMRKAEERAEIERLEEKRKAREAKRREEAEKRQNARAHAKAEQKRKRSEHGRKERREGNGGWIAAVVSLGAVSLALATTVTIGAIDMKRTKDGVASGYKSTTYELMGIMENVDNDLDRVRLSASPAQQERILTDLLVQARLAELDLEKLPIQTEKDRNITSFINRVAATSQRLLGKLRNGEKLSAEDEETLASLYAVNRSVRGELGDVIEKMTDKDLNDYIQKGKGMLADVMDKLDKLTLTENGKMLENKKMEGAGTQRTENEEQKPTGMDVAKAEEKCASYFEGYRIENYRCIGETVAHGYRAYNVQGYDDKGTLLFAEIDQDSGKLLRFDYYEECSENTFDMQNAQTIAETFLYKLGYESMTPVSVRENGTDVDFNFVYTTDGVVCYPDSVHIKVCRSRGVVTGFDATKYIKAHKQRTLPTAKLSGTEAKAKLHKNLTVERTERCLVQTERGERLAYEFLCSCEDARYCVYIDALNGAEIAIVNLKNLT